MIGGTSTQHLSAQSDWDAEIDWGGSWETRAQITSPDNSVPLNSSTVTFQWSAGDGVSHYFLAIGSSPGSRDLGSFFGTATWFTAPGILLNGNPLYASLWSWSNGQWQEPLVYTYQRINAQAATPAQIVAPPNGSTLSGSSVTFQWSHGAGAAQYVLQVGSARGGYDLANQWVGLNTSSTVANLPLDGRPIFVMLWTQSSGQWRNYSYQYTAASSTATGTGTDRMLRFDGHDDFVQIPIDASETSHTVTIWFRTTNPDCGIFSATAASGGHDRHIYLSKGNLCSRVWNDETIATKDKNYADGNWHQVTHVFGGGMGGQRLFVDTQLAASGNLAQSAFSWQDLIQVGYSADKGFFQGDIYDVRLWNRALSVEEIASQYRQRPNLGDAYLLGYWTFDEDPASNEVLNSAPRGGGKGTLGGNAQVAADDPKRVSFQQ